MTAETLRKLVATGFISAFAVFGLAACEDAGEVDPAVEDDGGLEEAPEDGMEDDEG